MFQTDTIHTQGIYNYADHSVTLDPPEDDQLDFYCKFDNTHGHENRSVWFNNNVTTHESTYYLIKATHYYFWCYIPHVALLF